MSRRGRESLLTRRTATRLRGVLLTAQRPLNVCDKWQCLARLATSVAPVRLSPRKRAGMLHHSEGTGGKNPVIEARFSVPPMTSRYGRYGWTQTEGQGLVRVQIAGVG